MAFTPITVTRRYLTAELTPATGTVRLTPTAPMVNGDTVVAASRVGTLDAEGDLTLVVAANNDPTTTPPGVSYEVLEQIDGQQSRSYYVVVPYDAAGGTVALSTLLTAQDPPVITYPAPGPQGPAGVTTIGGASDFTATGAAAGQLMSVATASPLAFALTDLDSDLTAIAALTPADDDVIQRKAGAWTNRTPAQLRADLDTSPVIPAGQYIYTISSAAANAVNTLVNGTLRVAPWLVPRTISLDRLVGEVTAVGEAGSKLRLGIYADNGAGYPGVLVTDAGQIAGDSVAVQELPISVTLPPGLYWIGGAVQSAPTTQPTVRIVSTGWHPTVPIRTGSTLPGAGSLAAGYSMTGVAGALPALFSATPATAGSVPRLLVRAA